MSIESFFVVAGYAIWIYILVCVIVKLNLYSIERKKEDMKKARIRDFLSSKTSCADKENQVKQMQKYANQPILFEEICRTYIKEKDEYEEEEKQFYESFMKDSVHKKITELGPHDDLERCALVQIIMRCELRSVMILAFVDKCQDENRMIDQLIKLEKEESRTAAPVID